jgi:MYXO-CTERM domain-containing protein
MRSARISSLAALVASLSYGALASAEPVDPVVIGWWSYFDDVKVPTTSSPAHTIEGFGDADTYYYEPSGGHGMQEDPNVLSPDQAWQNLVSYVLAKSNGVSLSPTFSIQTTSDLSALTEAYFGWALVLLYVPKDKYCDSYRVHIGSVDDGVQAMANGKILGYATLGQYDTYIDMVEYGTSPPELVLRPGINEVVLIHEDQAAIERYVTNVWIEHDGVPIDLAPKSIAWGRAFDSATQAPIYKANVGITGEGVSDTFLTGPFGFYFFSSLADGAYSLTADAAGYKTQTGDATLALGQGATEVVRVDLALELGCSCPDGTVCGPSGGCLSPCVVVGEVGEGCEDPAEVCVNHVCVKDPCDTLTCAPGFECQAATDAGGVAYGTCVELACSNVCCTPGEVCSGGACVPDGCAACTPPAETCAGGSCVDACSVVTCAGSLVCVGGVCLSPCDANPEGCGAGGGFTGFGGGGGSATSGSGGSGEGGFSGGTGAPARGAADDGGCGCRVGGSEEPSRPGWLSLAALASAAGLRRSRRSRRVGQVGRGAAAALLALLGAACTDSSDLVDGTLVPTGVIVDPAAFLQGVPCSPGEGAMQTYVATLIDCTEEDLETGEIRCSADPERRFTLPSSPPTSCSQPVTFRYVVDEHVYVAAIDGYETGLDGELTPYGGTWSGSRTMVDADGEAVTPRWTSSCGEGDVLDEGGAATGYVEGAATAVLYDRILAGGCEAMSDGGSAPPAAIVIDPAVSLGSYACVSDGGSIASFDVTPEGSLPTYLGVACGSDPITYATGLVDGESYTFRVAAVDGATKLAARCSAVARAGVTSYASCSPLTGEGALEIDVSEVLGAAGLDCHVDVETFEAQAYPLGLSAPVYTGGPASCDEVVRFAPLLPATWAAKVTARDADGAVALSATCFALVVPGETARASCSAVP